MFGKPKQTAIVAAWTARDAQFEAARRTAAASLAELRGEGTAEALGREVQAYLAAVDLLREAGHEPHWRGQ